MSKLMQKWRKIVGKKDSLIENDYDLKQQTSKLQRFKNKRFNSFPTIEAAKTTKLPKFSSLDDSFADSPNVSSSTSSFTYHDNQQQQQQQQKLIGNCETSKFSYIRSVYNNNRSHNDSICQKLLDESPCSPVQVMAREECKKSDTLALKGFKRVWPRQKSSSSTQIKQSASSFTKSNDENDENELSKKLEKKISFDENNNPKQKCTIMSADSTPPHIYCEIEYQNGAKLLNLTNDGSVLENGMANNESASEDEPLINFNGNNTNKVSSTINQDRLKNSYFSNIFGSTSNTSKTTSNDNKCVLSDATNDTLKCQPIDSKNKSLKSSSNLAPFYYNIEAYDLSKFVLSQASLEDKGGEGFEWYLSNLVDAMYKLIIQDQRYCQEDKEKRQKILNAHLVYARNAYELKSEHRHRQFDSFNPLLVALACLIDSDLVKIVDSHNCNYDDYLYAFETRIKFCTWKCKLYVILKRPKRSSLMRLRFIEELRKCHKQLEDLI